ncbi:MAG: hypothetical protein R2728_03230 [Chitinophagales bacterium]
MAIQNADRDEQKKLILEIFSKNPSLVKEVYDDLLREKDITSLHKEEFEEIDNLISLHIKKYGEVFKALS